MVDLHAHILPGLDDGSRSMEESIKMAKIAAASDIRHIAATSHGNYYPYTLEEYTQALEALQHELDSRRIPVRLHSGMEIYMDADALPLLKEGKLLPLRDTDYVLIEFSFDEDPNIVFERIEELRQAGYRIVLAHPERYLFIQSAPDIAWYLAQQGCVLQINQGSLIGDFGPECQKLSSFLLRERLAAVIATDAHDTRYRSHDLKRVLAWLRQRYSKEEIHIWLSENPSRILKGMEIVG